MPPKEEKEPLLLLLTNVENAAELRSMALSPPPDGGTSGMMALAKAALLPDLLQGQICSANAMSKFHFYFTSPSIFYFHYRVSYLLVDWVGLT